MKPSANLDSKFSVPYACPIHKVALGASFFCDKCDKQYPVFNGIPILLNDEESLFKTKDYSVDKSSYEGASSYAGALDNRKGIRQLYRILMRHLNESIPPGRDFGVNDCVLEILKTTPFPKVLVIGAGDRALNIPAMYTDVSYGKNVTCIADAHDLPFQSGSFDLCIACAVLEHVVDPYRCVDEIVRVLHPEGFVYAETPFMQPVHMGAYDFTRFSYLGHRRLFRRFDDHKSGVCGGVGISSGQMVRYAIASMSDSVSLKRWLKLIGVLATFPFRWIDYLNSNNISRYDSASGFYFFGKLRPDPLPDSELLKLYRGSS